MKWSFLGETPKLLRGIIGRIGGGILEGTVEKNQGKAFRMWNFKELSIKFEEFIDGMLGRFCGGIYGWIVDEITRWILW